VEENLHSNSGNKRRTKRPLLKAFNSQTLRTRQKMILAVGGALSLLLIGGLTAYLYFSDVNDAVANATGDYRSRGTGAWNGTSTWQRFNGSSWVNVTTSPTSSDGVITILTGHTITVTAAVTVDQVVISAGGQVNLNSGITLSLANGSGTDLTVNGIFQSAGTTSISGSASISFASGGTYIHNQNGGTIPTASWNSNSVCRITGVTSTYPAGTGQTFGHFTFNSALTSDVEMLSNLTTSGNLNIAGTGTRSLYLTNSSSNRTITVGGNLNDSAGTFVTVNSTGTGTINVSGNLNMAGGTFTMKTGAGNATLNVTGAINFSSGTLNVRTVSTTGTSVINLTGDYSMSGGTLDLSGNAAVGTLNVAGNFSHSGGTITESSTGSGSVVFNRSGTQTFASTGTVSNTINYTVNSGSTLVMGTSWLGNGSNGTFTLSSGGAISIGDPAGISSSGATGNIRVTGSRTFSTGANYIYAGSVAQVCGDGLPATVAGLTINNGAGLTLSSNVTVSNILTLTNGRITTGSNEIHVSNTSGSAITGQSTASYVVGNLRRNINSSGTYAFPLGTASEYELASVTLSGITGTTNILARFTNTNPLDVSNPLTSLLLNGTPVVDMLNYGYWTLTPNNPPTGGTFSFTASQRGFTNPSGNNSYTVLGRSGVGSDWQTPGTAISGNLSGGTVTATRSGFTTFYDYGIGISERPLPMVFMNSSLISGTAGQVNATYKFPNVCTGVDAWIRITDIDGGAILDNIDNFSGGNGYDIAWQPFVSTVSNDTSSIGWRIQFKKAGTSVDTTLQNVAITGIDIDGTTNLREFVEATWPYSYSLATVTTLTVDELDSSYRATGGYSVISNIDTSRTEAMYQINYSSINSFSYRTGAISTRTDTEIRQHALMFNSTLSNNSPVNSSLPVSLIYFTPSAKSDYVELKWATSSEINNDFFTLERSSDGKFFTELERIKGRGNSTITNTYLRIDHSPLQGNNYYRLKQTDYDGKTTTFPVKVIRIGAVKTDKQINIATTGPNPFSDYFSIDYDVAQRGNVDVQIMNTSGQTIYSNTISADEGRNSFTFNSGGALLPAGVYLVVLNYNGEVVSVKVKKQ
jgi:hypothetical protein